MSQCFVQQTFYQSLLSTKLFAKNFPVLSRDDSFFLSYSHETHAAPISTKNPSITPGHVLRLLLQHNTTQIDIPITWCNESSTAFFYLFVCLLLWTTTSSRRHDEHAGHDSLSPPSGVCNKVIAKEVHHHITNQRKRVS